MDDAPAPMIWTNADDYEAMMGRWSRPAARTALTRLGCPPRLAWLDVGCGTGSLTRAMLEIADPTEVLAVDPSSDFLELATAQIRDSRVRFAHGNAQSLPAENERFDVAVSGLVLHFVPDPKAAVIEIARTVRNGGTVAGYIWDVDDEQQFTRPFWRAAADVDPAAGALDPRTQFNLHGTESLANVWTHAGLQKVTAAVIESPTVFRDFEDYWQPCLLDGATPIQRYARSLGAEQQVALRERLRVVLPVAVDRSITLLGRLMIVRGTK